MIIFSFNHYNIIDVVVLTEAFLKFSRSFYKNFQLNTLEFVSLPGMAEKAMWSNYDATVNSPYTFHNNFKSIAQLIRTQIIGGLSCCFHRHAATVKEPINDVTMRTPSGKPIKLIKSFDVNSMLSLSFTIFFYLFFRSIRLLYETKSTWRSWFPLFENGLW